MSRLSGHLGSRVSALVDGQLPDAEAERAWRHVAGCGTCRASVEREAWVKNRLSLGGVEERCPSGLAGSLEALPYAVDWSLPLDGPAPRGRRSGMALVGVGSVSVALVGLVTVGWGLDGAPPSGVPAETSIVNGVTRDASPTPSP